MTHSSRVVSAAMGMSCWWSKRRYVIEERKIQPALPSKDHPFDVFAQSDERPFVNALVHLDIGNSRAIEDFASEWGLLGLHDAPLLLTASLHGETVVPAKTVRVWDGTCYRERDLWDYSRPYFPGLVNAPGVESLILGPARWAVMVEPLEEFREAVKEFRKAFNRCLEWRKSGQVEVPGGLILHHLHHLSLVPLEDGGIGLSCACPLAAAYAMLTAYLSPNVRLCAREKCGRPYVTDRADRQFCSQKCQNAEGQREHRAKTKANR